MFAITLHCALLETSFCRKGWSCFDGQSTVENRRVRGGVSTVQMRFLEGLDQEPPPRCGDCNPSQVTTPAQRIGTKRQLPPERTEGGGRLAGGTLVNPSSLTVFEVLWPSEIPWHSF